MNKEKISVYELGDIPNICFEEELQQRINKAIKYIWSTKYEYGDLEEDNEDFDIDVYKLLNILEGSDNNE